MNGSLCNCDGSVRCCAILPWWHQWSPNGYLVYWRNPPDTMLPKYMNRIKKDSNVWNRSSRVCLCWSMLATTLMNCIFNSHSRLRHLCHRGHRGPLCHSIPRTKPTNNCLLVKSLWSVSRGQWWCVMCWSNIVDATLHRGIHQTQNRGWNRCCETCIKTRGSGRDHLTQVDRHYF